MIRHAVGQGGYHVPRACLIGAAVRRLFVTKVETGTEAPHVSVSHACSGASDHARLARPEIEALWGSDRSSTCGLVLSASEHNMSEKELR